MTRTIRFAIILSFLSVLALGISTTDVCAKQWARQMFKVTKHDFGNVAKNSLTEFRFDLSNIYMEDVHIASVTSTCGCTTPRIEKKTLKTYERGAIIAHFNTDRFTGSKGATLTVTIDRPYYAQVQLHVKGYIRSDVVFSPGSVNLGTAEEGQPVERTVSVRLYNGGQRILKIESPNPSISVKPVLRSQSYSGSTYDLHVRSEGDIPPGYINDRLLLTLSGSQRKVPLEVAGRVTTGITVSPSALFLGVVEPGRKITKKLVVHGRTPFRVTRVLCDDNSFSAELPQDGIAKRTHVIPVTFMAREGDQTGRVTRKIQIETDTGRTMPELAAHAVISAAEGAN